MFKELTSKHAYSGVIPVNKGGLLNAYNKQVKKKVLDIGENLIREIRNEFEMEDGDLTDSDVVSVEGDK
jgi:hypothetical protein